MKAIAIISDHASPLADLGGVDSGGQNVYVKQIASHLASLGHAVDVFTRRDSPDLPEIVECGRGVRVVHVTAGPPGFVKKEELLKYMNEFTEQMIAYCSRRTYDIIHANFWMSGLAAAQIKRILQIPFVITFHALGRIRRMFQNDADKFPDVRFTIEDMIIRECDGIIAECPQDRADLMTLYHAPNHKISIIPCGFDPRELYPIGKGPARSALGLPRDVPLLLQLGRIVPRKGIDTTIRGFAVYVRESHSSARLAVVGGAGKKADFTVDPELKRLRDIAVEEGVGDRVLFAGRASRDEIKYYFSAADMFITTPWYEPFGITPVESMACGTPVIGARVGGIKYTVRDQITGLLIPANDSRAISDALARLYGTPGLLERMGKNAVLRVNRMFTWEIVTSKIIRLYDKVLMKTGSRRQAAYTVAGMPEPALSDHHLQGGE